MNVFKLIEENGLNLHGDIEHFAELIRQEEREACAMVAEQWPYEDERMFSIAQAIRSRGEQ